MSSSSDLFILLSIIGLLVIFYICLFIDGHSYDRWRIDLCGVNCSDVYNISSCEGWNCI